MDGVNGKEVAAFTKMVPLQTIAPAVGLTAPGFLNASCGGWYNGTQVRRSMRVRTVF